MNIVFNSLLAKLVKYDVHTTRKIKSIHAIYYHILLLYKIKQWYNSHNDDNENSSTAWQFASCWLHRLAVVPTSTLLLICKLPQEYITKGQQDGL